MQSIERWMGRLRLRLSPVSVQPARGPLRVLGLRVGFSEFGPTSSQAAAGAPKPAEITFHASVFSQIRGQTERARTPFAKIRGEIALAEPGGPPEFVLPAVPATELVEYDPPLSERVEADGKSQPRRSLRLEFDEDQFFDVPPDEVRLLLPDEAQQGPAHLEIDATLAIGGAEEAPLGASDTLDVPLPRLKDTRAVIRVVDEAGEPLADTRVAVRLPDGSESEQVTDENGEIFFEAVDDEKFELLRLIEDDEQAPRLADINRTDLRRA